MRMGNRAKAAELDSLIKLAEFYKVSTDFILGLDKATLAVEARSGVFLKPGRREEFVILFVNAIKQIEGRLENKLSDYTFRQSHKKSTRCQRQVLLSDCSTFLK